MDHGTEEHALGLFLSQLSAGLPGFRPDPKEVVLWPRLGTVRAGFADQDRHRTLAGGDTGRPLVETGQAILEEGRVATISLFPCRACSRPRHRLGGTKALWRPRRGVSVLPARAMPDRRPRDLVPPGQAFLAGEFVVHVLPLEH